MIVYSSWPRSFWHLLAHQHWPTSKLHLHAHHVPSVSCWHPACSPSVARALKFLTTTVPRVTHSLRPIATPPPPSHFTRAPRYFVGPYLVVITGRAEIGCIYQHSVWEVKRAMCVPFARNRRHLSAAQLRIEDRYIQMIQSVFDTTVMYFSYSYVLHSLIASKAGTTPCACEVYVCVCVCVCVCLCL